MMFSARIIVILSGCEDVNGEVQRLLSIDVVNLVTGETMEDALDELVGSMGLSLAPRLLLRQTIAEARAFDRLQDMDRERALRVSSGDERIEL